MIELAVAFALGLGVGWMLNERARLDRDFWMAYAVRLERITVWRSALSQKPPSPPPLP